jgi:hypothetical protein
METARMNTCTLQVAIKVVCRIVIILFLVFIARVYLLPYLQMFWNVTFPHYDHEIVVLPFDIDCQVEGHGEKYIVKLPKGTMLYSPCKHDFSRMSLDESCVYKLYVRLTPSTIKKLVKDTDLDRRDEFNCLKDYDTIEERSVNVQQ